jgi:hypothetical protein
MPFRRPDGSPYFEAPELIADAPVELAVNHLALCPTCCAKWHHARASTDAEVTDALRTAQNPEITVSLAGRVTIIRFVRVHLEDLRTIMSATFDRPSRANA